MIKISRPFVFATIALVLGTAMTVSASAQIWSWNDKGASPAAHALSPCPVGFEFRRGFCVTPR